MISIVVSIYNVEKYLNKCIESFLNQTHKDFELLLIDDGSPDKCPALCDEWSKKDERIKVFHKQNGGISSARNYGMDRAKGDFIIFPNPDDWVEPDYLEKLLSNIKEYNADLSICGHYYGNVIGNEKANFCLMDRDEALRQLMLPHSFCGYTWNKLYYLDIIKSNHLRFNEKYGMIEDLHFNIFYFQLCKTIVYEPAPKYHHVINGNEITSLAAPLSPRKLSALITYKEIATLFHDKYPDLEAISYSSLCNMCLQDIIIYYKTRMKQKNILNLLKSSFKQHRKTFYHSNEYTVIEKRCSKFVTIHPWLYYLTRRLYLRFWGRHTLKHKKRILICNDMLCGGGAETLLQIFTDAFVKKGYDVTIMSSPKAYNDYKKYFSNLFPSGVHYIQGRLLTKRKSITNFIARKAYRLFILFRIALKNYDIAIAQKDGYIMKEVSSLRTKRKIAWIQSDYRLFHQKDYLQVFSTTEKELKCIKKFEKIVCVSETAKKGFIDSIGDVGTLLVRYNPIDVKKIQLLSEEKSDYKRDLSRQLLVSVGGLFPVKNFISLLEACRNLRDKIQFDLWIIGDGPQRNELELYIKTNNLSNVKLLGFQSNPYSIIKQADLFVSSSTSETYGLAIQEALILEVPVIAVKNPGIIEALNPEFGILVDNSIDDISKAIFKLLSNPEETKKYKKSIKENYHTNLLYENRMEKICYLLE